MLKIRVLVVDDEYDVTYSLKTCLEGTGLIQVDGFIDPIKALANFKPDTYDLVILDIRMPVMNGFELYQKLKVVDDNVTVCFLTAVHNLREYEKDYPHIIEAIERNEIKCFMDKPVGSEQLIKMVSRTIK